MSELILTTAKGGQFWVDYVDTTAPENFNVFYFESESDEQPHAGATDSEDWYDAIDQLCGYCPNEDLGQLWAQVHPLPDHVEAYADGLDFFDGDYIKLKGKAWYYNHLLPAFSFYVLIPITNGKPLEHFVAIDPEEYPEHLALATETLLSYLEARTQSTAERWAHEYEENF